MTEIRCGAQNFGSNHRREATNQVGHAERSSGWKSTVRIETVPNSIPS
jgi:hypothetical protein